MITSNLFIWGVFQIVIAMKCKGAVRSIAASALLLLLIGYLG